VENQLLETDMRESRYTLEQFPEHRVGRFTRPLSSHQSLTCHGHGSLSSSPSQ